MGCIRKGTTCYLRRAASRVCDSSLIFCSLHLFQTLRNSSVSGLSGSPINGPSGQALQSVDHNNVSAADTDPGFELRLHQQGKNTTYRLTCSSADFTSLTQDSLSKFYFFCSFLSFQVFYAHPFFRTCLLADLSCPSLLISNYLGLSHAKISPEQTNSDPSVLACLPGLPGCHSSLVQLFLPLAPPPEVPLSCPSSPLRMDDLLKTL